MEAILISAGIALFTSFTGLVTYLMVAFVKHVNSANHSTPDERKNAIDAIDARIAAHAAIDEQRFKSIEEMLKEMRSDIKTLLNRKTRTR